MRKIFYTILITIFLTACSVSNEINIKDKAKENKNMNEITLKINDNDYKLILEDNETVSDLINHIPLNLSMNELNGNEYYSYLDFILKDNPENINNIKAGDVMLYGNNCIVIFYKSFTTTYKYTRIGHIDSIDNLEQDLNSEKIIFSK